MTISTQKSLTIVLATGGTGGHIFPAQALAEVLLEQGHRCVLATDKRFEAYRTQGAGVLASVPLHILSASAMGGGLSAKFTALGRNTLALFQARRLLTRLKPDVVVGFGGYPSFPTMMAAAGRYPTLIHEQNALLGKTNRVLAGRVDAIATSFDATGMVRTEDEAKLRPVGNPVRSGIAALRGVPYPVLQPDGIMQVLITGGSQGASVFGEVLPRAVSMLPEALRARLRIDQQARPEQIEELKAAYRAIGVQAQLMPFFTDIPARLAGAHLVVARSGASTVAELTCAGRPAILVPLPRSADDHQTINARALDDAGGGWLMPQEAFTAEALAARLESFLNLPASLEKAAQASRELGRPQAAQALAALVAALARGEAEAVAGQAALQEVDAAGSVTSSAPMQRYAG